MRNIYYYSDMEFSWPIAVGFIVLIVMIFSIPVYMAVKEHDPFVAHCQLKGWMTEQCKCWSKMADAIGDKNAPFDLVQQYGETCVEIDLSNGGK